MQPGSDYTTSYYNYNHPPPPHLQNPNPNPNPNPSPNPSLSDPFLRSHASAPPFSNYSSSDYTPSTYSSPYPHYSQNSNPVPPTAPSYNQPYPHLQQQPPYYPYDPSSANPNPNPNPDPAYSATYPHSYAPSGNENPSDGGEFGYPNPNSGRYGLGQTAPDLQTGFYETGGRQFDQGGPQGGGFEEGVYAYDGGKDEPYGARGIGGFKSASSARFDDYGRTIGFEEEKVGSGKIVRASPKMEAQQDVKNGVQKFRVKLLPEGSGQTMDVLCQIGLDGIRMLDPSTNRTLRIYPLESVIRWEVTESSIYTFWAKSPVDIEPRRIRLQSNRYTTNTILDIVAAASVQLKEMGGNRIQGPADSGKPSEQTTERKKGFPDWINFIKPGNEEKDHWVPDEAVNKCIACGTDFGAFVRRHHCRNCGDIFCDKCTQGRTALTADEQAQPVRVCDRCLAEVSQRLDNAKETVSKSAVQQSHEDLARKLQEEMDRNRKGSSGLKSTDASGRQMKEVACPTCTVHLQVQVPTSGSETIECGVCQHPFLVSAH